MSQEQKGGVFAPICEADVKRIEREIEQNDDDPDTVEEWVENAVHRELGERDGEHEWIAEVDIDVPPEVAERVELRMESRRQRDGIIEDEELARDDLLFNFTQVEPNWYADGELIHRFDRDR